MLGRGAAAAAILLSAGCGGQGPAPLRVTVPEGDSTPPEASIALILPSGRSAATAEQPGHAPAEHVVLGARRFDALAQGFDGDSGVARVRVATRGRAKCMTRAGRSFGERYVRYYPPPQIERIRAAPGAWLATRAPRRLRLVAGRGACPAQAVTAAVEGEVWGEAINGIGLEAVTSHVRFSWTRR